MSMCSYMCLFPLMTLVAELLFMKLDLQIIPLEVIIIFILFYFPALCNTNRYTVESPMLSDINRR